MTCTTPGSAASALSTGLAQPMQTMPSICRVVSNVVTLYPALSIDLTISSNGAGVVVWTRTSSSFILTVTERTFY
ncbi:hypothetical protein LP420_38585 [Massilia sp. B-10]|nr:hypothetical protein LP420_38585 [Massilia sp. B-10]